MRTHPAWCSDAALRAAFDAGGAQAAVDALSARMGIDPEFVFGAVERAGFFHHDMHNPKRLATRAVAASLRRFFVLSEKGMIPLASLLRAGGGLDPKRARYFLRRLREDLSAHEKLEIHSLVSGLIFPRACGGTECSTT